MNHRRLFLIVVCIWAACVSTAWSAVESRGLTGISDVRIERGHSRTLRFDLAASRRVVLFLQTRAHPTLADATLAPAHFIRGEAPAPDLLGLHGVGLRLDGDLISNRSARLLRREDMVFQVGGDEHRSVPLYDAETGRWLVKYDRDYQSLNHRFAGMPWLKHYYQLALDLGELPEGEHRISIRAAWSEEAAAEHVHVRKMTVLEARRDALVTATDWMKPVFGWQPPAVEDLAEGDLSFQACAGEYEPLSFGVYALDGLKDIEVSCSGLRGDGAEIPAANVRVFRIRALKRGSLGEAGFLARMPFVPERWRRHSPELLIPQSEGPVDIGAATLQRYYVDVKVPAGMEPGRYRGMVRVRSGKEVVRELPVVLRVLPFDLAEGRTQYWMWRLTWSPLWQPENVACLRDIVEHGCAGLTRMCGASFKFRIGEHGAVRVNDSAYRRAVEAMKNAGMERQVADDHVSHQLLGTITNHLGLELDDLRRNLPRLEEYLRERARNQATVAEAKEDLSGRLDGPEEADGGGGDLLGELKATDGNEDQEEVLAKASRRARRLQKKIHDLAVEGFRKVKQKADSMGLRLFVFPVDEPDGTPWRRRWTTYAAGLAKEAGLETWSTRNAVDWEGHIDHKAFGGKINAMYREPRVASDSYEGGLAINPLPMIGAFRGGAKYHFAGEIDEVRIYNRALSADELKKQYRSPARRGLLAHYSFDKAKGGEIVRDDSGNGHHLQTVRTPQPVEGHTGRAMHFNGTDEHLVPVTSPRERDAIDLSDGYTISLWYRGKGAMFGAGYDFYPEAGSKLRFTTTKQQKRWFGHSGFQSRRFWQHITYTFDPTTRTVRAYVQNPEMRRWYRENIRWNYVQIRSMPPKNPRYKTGIMAWYYANLGELTNMTTFCYDWNANHLYVAYPKNGDRFNEEGVWYRTLGWEGTREGIDDARYLQTLAEMLMEREGIDREEAVGRVREVIDDVGVGYEISQVIRRMGGYGAMRERVIERILELR
jgi:hypothetical protein